MGVEVHIWCILLAQLSLVVLVQAEAAPLLPTFAELDLSHDGCISLLEYEVALSRLRAEFSACFGQDSSTQPPRSFSRDLLQIEERTSQSAPPLSPQVSFMPSPPDGSDASAVVVIDSEAAASTQLAQSVADMDTAAVVLRVNATLRSALARVTRTLSLTGECHSTIESYCIIDGDGRFRVLEVFGQDGNLTLRHIHLTNGYLTGPNVFGGAGLLLSQGSVAVVDECHVSQCDAESTPGSDIHTEILGGAGVAVFFGSQLWMANTRIEHCSLRLSLGGAGVGFFGGSGTLLNCSFLYNTVAESLGGGGIGVLDFSQDANGTAVWSSNVSITGSYIAHNFGAETVGGAGVGICPTAPIAASIHVTLENTAVHNNSFDGDSYDDEYSYGGGLLSFGLPGFETYLAVQSCEFRMNRARKEGGSAFLWTSSTSAVAHSVFRDSSSQGSGGGLATADAVLNLTDTWIFGNSARQGGGGCFRYEGTTDFSVDYWNALQVERVLFQDNTATTSGGGLYTDSTSVSIIDSNFQQNAADEGGNLFMTQTIAAVSHCLFAKGFAYSRGGGIAIEENGSNGLWLQDTRITECRSDVYGGGIYIMSDSPMILSDLLLDGNVAGYHGGNGYMDGNYNEGNMALVVDVSNTNIEAGQAGSDGAGLYVFNMHAFLTNTTIFSCVAARYGGAVAFAQMSIVTLDRVYIRDNLADKGEFLQMLSALLFPRKPCALT
ncbi:hypothetical protein CYMTET_30416 [Cymbomonas tetramitiformis]|uniref:Pectate lyase C n=1 Tax=Cymbomonas tetramitiformis TaxID=36881 RepID=A0AAE0KTY7_9CHLO|nr:hypothetical protein CYMTET_30416 [Cymbomonas tetramitiformis]